MREDEPGVGSGPGERVEPTQEPPPARAQDAQFAVALVLGCAIAWFAWPMLLRAARLAALLVETRPLAVFAALAAAAAVLQYQRWTRR